MAQNKSVTQMSESGIGRRRAAARDEGRAGYQERRAEIMSAAADLFKREGFRGTSIGRIAQALGMDRATLYYYISSKEEIFDEVVSGAVRSNVAMARKIRSGDGTPPDKLRALITSLMRSYSENYPLLYVFLQENLDHVAPTRTAWSQQMRRLNKAYEDVLIRIIQDGLDDGSIRPVADARVIAYGVMGMVGWTNRWFDPGKSGTDAAAIGTAYADMVLSGLTARRSTRAGAAATRSGTAAIRGGTAKRSGGTSTGAQRSTVTAAASKRSAAR
jgi:AcrR family transcriptional regulator